MGHGLDLAVRERHRLPLAPVGEVVQTDLEAMDRDDAATEAVEQGATPAEARERTGGRPKGAINRRTEEWSRYLLSRYRSPLVMLAETYSRPVGELAAELGCTRLEAMQCQIRAADLLAPYVHSRMPTAVNVDGAAAVSLVFAAPETIAAAADPTAGRVEQWPALEGSISTPGESLRNQRLSDNDAAHSDAGDLDASAQSRGSPGVAGDASADEDDGARGVATSRRGRGR